MNALKDAIDNISDTLKSPNSETNGIVPAVNRIYDAIWGTETADDASRTFGIYTYMEKLTPDVYGKHVKFDSTNPEGFVSDENLRKYINGTYQPLNTITLNSDSNRVNSTVQSQFDLSGEIEDRYYGIAQASFNTQLHSEYTRMRLYAHENQYRPTGIYFNDVGNTRFVAEASGRSAWSTNNSISIDAANNIHLIASTLNLESRDNKIELKAPEVIIGNLTIGNGAIQGIDNTIETSIGTIAVPITNMFVKSVTVQDALQSNDVSATTIVTDVANIGTEVVGTSSVESSAITEANITSATIEGAVINNLSTESSQIKDITLLGKLSGGTIDSTTLNNVQVSSDILPHDDKDVSIGSSTKPFFDVYATKLISTDGELTGEQKTSDNSIVKYVTLKSEIDARTSADTQHTKEIESLNKATENLTTKTQTLSSSIDSIQKDIEDIKANPVNVEFEESQFDVDVNVVSLKSFSDAVDGSYPVKSGGIITWVKPDNTTVEGMAQSIATLETKVSTLQTSVDSYEGRVTTLETQVTTLRTEFDTLVIDEGSID